MRWPQRRSPVTECGGAWSGWSQQSVGPGVCWPAQTSRRLTRRRPVQTRHRHTQVERTSSANAEHCDRASHPDRLWIHPVATAEGTASVAFGYHVTIAGGVPTQTQSVCSDTQFKPRSGVFDPWMTLHSGVAQAACRRNQAQAQLPGMSPHMCGHSQWKHSARRLTCDEGCVTPVFNNGREGSGPCTSCGMPTTPPSQSVCQRQTPLGAQRRAPWGDDQRVQIGATSRGRVRAARGQRSGTESAA